MKKAYAVIGAQFGDEGKGAMVNYLSKLHPDSVVVRYNGGAQAGHTVEDQHEDLPVRHVFGHIGSGFFQSKPTYLSEDFICNPFLYFKEKKELLQKTTLTNTQVYVHPRARVSTPYDMYINQIIEKARGQNSHGSCGVGIFETVKRFESANAQFLLRYEDLQFLDKIKEACRHIKEGWLPQRLRELGHNQIIQAEAMQHEKEIIANYIDAANQFYLDTQPLANPADFGADNLLIFEGAQGLMLDQELGIMPHLTPSYTGLPNILKLAKEQHIQELEVFYMSRVYTTRHGQGPLPHELPKPPYPLIEDKTNITNAYQGSLRFAYIDLDQLSDFIYRDLQRNHTTRVVPHLVITCCDQLGEQQEVSYYQNNELHTKPLAEFLAVCFETFQMEVFYNSSAIYSPQKFRPSKQQFKKHL